MMSSNQPGVAITISGLPASSCSCYFIDDPPMTTVYVRGGDMNFDSFSNIDAH